MKHMKHLALLLTAVLVLSGFTMLAPQATGTNLVVNGGFEDGVNNWTYSGEANELIGTLDPAEGTFYAKPAAGSYLQQIIPVEGHKTYKLSFKMQSTVENAATLIFQAAFMAENTSYRNIYTSTEDDPDQYRAIITENAFSNAAFGTAGNAETLAWKEYSLLIPVPSMKIDAFRLRLIFGNDSNLAVDDIRFEKVKDDCAAVINGDFENASAASLTSAAAWSSSTGYTYAQNGGADNSKYFKGDLGTELFYQLVPVEENTTYRLNFKMKSSKKDGASLNLASTNLVYKDNVAVKSIMTNNNVNFGLSDYTGEDAEVWRNYSLELSTPAGVNILRLAIQNNGDTALGIDDISIEKTEGKMNYIMNGNFEAGMAAWGDVGGSGTVAEEENGNLYFSRTAAEHSKYIRQWPITLPAGRYKLSFKAKTENRGDRVRVNLLGYDGSAKQEEIAGWFADYIDGKTATCNASYSDDWQTFNFYFTLPEERSDIVVALPTARYGASNVGKAWFDDVSITKDETRFEFASYTQESVTTEAFCEAKNGETVTKLVVGETVPVTAHYIPETEGISEKVALTAALYKEKDGAKQLVGFKVVSGETLVSEETMQGKNAGAILSLATDMEIPDDADNTYVLKASLYRDGTLVDVAYKTISLGW